jgi:hypothetical protein
LTILFGVATLLVLGWLAYLVSIAPRPVTEPAAADPGSPPGALLVPTVVTIDDPASGVAHVRLDFDEPVLRGRPDLLIAFADVHGRPNVIRSFTAAVDGAAVVTGEEVYRGAMLRRIPLGGAARGASVSYTIDPTLYPDWPGTREPADARSRITQDLAIVRSTSLLPVLDVAGATLAIEFVLPPQWTAITPWIRDGDASTGLETSRVRAPAEVTAAPEYLAFGPFEIRELPGTPLRIAQLRGTADAPSLEAMLRRLTELIGVPPEDNVTFVSILVPDTFMRGGAAGRHTAVQSPQPEVIAHELFHWWNHGTLTSADAAWFREGLSQFYGARVAREAQAWTADQEAACFADLEAEMRTIERLRPRGLMEASRDAAAHRLIYSKGALFWLVAEQHLRMAGRDLSEAIRRIVTSRRSALTTLDLRGLFSETYGSVLDEDFDRYVMGTEILPALGLPAATGRSGCARQHELPS